MTDDKQAIQKEYDVYRDSLFRYLGKKITLKNVNRRRKKIIYPKDVPGKKFTKLTVGFI